MKNLLLSALTCLAAIASIAQETGIAMILGVGFLLVIPLRVRIAYVEKQFQPPGLFVQRRSVGIDVILHKWIIMCLLKCLRAPGTTFYEKVLGKAGADKKEG